MNKRLLLTLGAIIIVLIGAYALLLHKLTLNEKQLIQKFSELQVLCNEKKAQGYNVTEAEELLRRAKRALSEKDYEASNRINEDDGNGTEH